MIPLVLGLLDRDGKDLPLMRDDGNDVRARRARPRPSRATASPSPTSRQPPVLSLNRGFSAPVKIVANQSADDLRFLAAHDTDPFNRWQAVQTLATSLLIDNVAALRAGRTPRHGRRPDRRRSRAILADRSLEPAFVAQAMMMPSEADIARDIGRDVDPDAIFAARAAAARRHRRPARRSR